MLKDCQKENEEAERQKLQGANWTGNRPWIRFYHSMTRDNAIVALSESLKVLSRAELDARNNKERPATFWEIVAQNFNDKQFVVYSESYPELHSTFADVMKLKFEDMPGGAITVGLYGYNTKSQLK